MPPGICAQERAATSEIVLSESMLLKVLDYRGLSRLKEGNNMVAKYFYQQNEGKLSTKPPSHLGKIAGECWRKIVPFLEATGKVQRIDTSLVEMYCVLYEIYRNCYDDIKENGVQTAIKRSVQNSAGEIIAEDFTGWRKNPAASTMKDTVSQLNQIGIQLGLTPKGREELMTIADSEKNEESTEDALKKFFGGKK